MKKILFCFLVLGLFSSNSLSAQSNKRYSSSIEKILDFEKSELKDTLHIAAVIKGTNALLNKRIQKAQKLKKNPDSVTTKTIDFLKSMKRFTSDTILLKLSETTIEAIAFTNDSITNIDQALYGLHIVDQLDKEMLDLLEKLKYLIEESEELFTRINAFREKNDIALLNEEKDPVRNFAENYVIYFFNDMISKIDKYKAREAEIRLLLEKERPSLYSRQRHRFEFIDGILHYNDNELRKGQTIKDIEEMLGADYIETGKEDEDHYGMIRYQNIPLRIGFEGDVIQFFDIYLKTPTSNKDNYSFLDEDFIKLENHYFNKDYNSIKSLVSILREETYSAFKMGDPSDGYDKFVCYNNPDDKNYNENTEVDRHFYLTLDYYGNEIKRIRYEEE